MSVTASDTTSTTSTTAAERCGQCGVPAAHDQRYCLNCGFHRRNAPDPVSRYLSEASAARARVAAADALMAQRRRIPRLGPRVVATLVALALIVGLLIGNLTAGGSSPSTQSPSHQASQHHKASPVKSETGSKYLQQEENLPTTVSP